MTPLKRFAYRLRRLLRRRQSEAEMAEEMRFHLAQRAADYAADGQEGEEARYAAQRKFGNVGRIQEEARDAHGWGWLERALKDLRCGMRQLAKNPGFTVLAIVTLGLGVGANTAMFSVLNVMLFKPLPYPGVEQLDRFQRITPQATQVREGNFSPADFLDFQRTKEGYGDVAAYTLGNTSLAEPGRPADMAYAARSTTNMFSLLGIAPQLGRDFLPEEATLGRDRVVILNHRVWQNRFGARPDIIGHTIRVDGEPHVIVGVMSREFNDGRHLGVIDFYRPLVLDREQASDRNSTTLRIFGRRAANRSPEEAAAYVAGFGQRLAVDFPDVHTDTSWKTLSFRMLVLTANGIRVVPMMIGLSAAVLLIACSNLANLLLARAMVRAREFAVRAALGASRLQLLRPLIAESLLLALGGGVCAIILSLWFHDWAAVRSTDDNGDRFIMTLDWNVAGWAFGIAVVTAFAFGLAPALFALRLDLNHTLKSGGRQVAGGEGHQRFRQALIVLQFAFAMILLTAAGLFIRGLYDLNNRRVGWSSEDLVTGTILLPAATYPDAEKINAFHRLALERLSALPGVAGVSISSFAPFYNWPESRKFVVEGRARPAAGREPAAVMNRVSPHYFDTFGTHLIAGRAFNARDNASSSRVFIVSQSTARLLFRDENPLGRRIAQASGDQLEWGDVVGIAHDVQSASAEKSPVLCQIYRPMAQEPKQANEIAVRLSGAAASTMTGQIRATIAALDPDLPVRKLQPANTTIERFNYQLGVLRDMLGVMAALGLGLAALGIYGIISRTMAQRTGEFAIRLALGASIGNLNRMVLASGVKLAFVGAGLGLLGAFGVFQVFSLAFPGMSTGDVAIPIMTTLLLVAIALVACWLPARRAGKVDAMTVLRAE